MLLGSQNTLMAFLPWSSTLAICRPLQIRPLKNISRIHSRESTQVVSCLPSWESASYMGWTTKSCTIVLPCRTTRLGVSSFHHLQVCATQPRINRHLVPFLPGDFKTGDLVEVRASPRLVWLKNEEQWTLKLALRALILIDDSFSKVVCFDSVHFPGLPAYIRPLKSPGTWHVSLF